VHRLVTGGFRCRCRCGNTSSSTTTTLATATDITIIIVIIVIVIVVVVVSASCVLNRTKQVRWRQDGDTKHKVVYHSQELLVLLRRQGPIQHRRADPYVKLCHRLRGSDKRGSLLARCRVNGRITPFESRVPSSKRRREWDGWLSCC